MAKSATLDPFDEGSTMARINEIGGPSVIKWFANRDTPERHENRSQKRMTEFLVKDAVPLTRFDCIVAKSDWIKTEVRYMMNGTGINLPAYSKPECYF